MRAWHCHGRNQRDLVDRLMQAGIVQSPAVRDVLRLVDRQYYTDQQPYMDAPQGIGYGQTISAPHMHAHVLEEMLPALQRQAEPLAILDVGCGSGYLTACLGRWLQGRSPSTSILAKTGRVYGIDIYDSLVAQSKANLAKHDADLLAKGVVKLSTANGWDGLPSAAPFDAIHVGAAAGDFPTTLATQLKVGGVLIVPIGPNGGAQSLYKIERTGGDPSKRDFRQADYRIRELLGVRYVPLIQGPQHP